MSPKEKKREKEDRQLNTPTCADQLDLLNPIRRENPFSHSAQLPKSSIPVLCLSSSFGFFKFRHNNRVVLLGPQSC